MSESTANDTTDVLIVGAGMAGLYTAWRLLQTQPERRVHILERLPRTGGRLETDHVLVDGVSVKTEEGGMRFLQSHVELTALLKALGLWNQVVPFPMGDDHNLYYLRGQRFTRGDAAKDPGIWSRLYALNAGAVGQQPGDILTELLTKVLKENGVDPATWPATPEAWTTLRASYVWRGIPLYQWGFWALLTDYGLSPDCIEMLYQSSGFIAPFDQEVNAGCALQLLVDFVDPSFHTLAPGYEALPNALATAVRAAGATIALSHEVVGMERDADSLWSVRARRTDRTTVTLRANQVVMAVTQIAFQKLIPFVPAFRDSTQFTSDVNSLTDMELGKINLYYEKNWWTPATGIASGGSWTDLPLAQFYCFGGETGAAGPASISLYTDFDRTAYWAQLQALGEPYRVANAPSLPPYSEAATTYVVEQATAQMKEMFGLASIPAPLVATYRRWGIPSAGDGDHQWRMGAFDPDIRRRLTSPFPHVYTCGESYSDDQAWVNGALRSVDQMLAAHPDLARHLTS
ncbi:MAG TPA: FAD-dependent oxidoreductase [Gemmatimonadaceae bacterium]